MRVRTQLAVIAVIAAGWAAGNVTVSEPALAEMSRLARMNDQELESLVAREPGNVHAARALSRRYLELREPRMVLDAVSRMSPAAQRDGWVALHTARAREKLGELQAASAGATGALNRCQSIPHELADAHGCDVRATTELALELAAVDRMIAWGIDPVSDPSRAALAHDVAARPVRLVSPR